MRVTCRSIDRLPPAHKRGHVYDNCHFTGEAARGLLAGDIHGIELESCSIEGVSPWKASHKSGETCLYWERYVREIVDRIERITDNDRLVIEVSEKLGLDTPGTIIVNGIRQPMKVIAK